MEGQQPPKKRNKHIQKPEYKNLTPFKQLQKHFKYYQHQETDYSIVYEPEKYQNILGYQIAIMPFPEGGILVRNFNPPEVVFGIALNALNVYCNKPYRTNLQSREELYKEEKEQTKTLKQQNKQEQTIKQQLKVPQQKEYVNEDKKGYFFNDKIRWANVGYQYDWTERKYPKMKTIIPQSINQLCLRANKLFNAIHKTNKNYHPESAIINYYSEKDYMTGHLDDAEVDQASPIYSFAFGLSCIFLIGGKTKDIKPISVRLNSGDLFIMGGPSRQCYHGVPRIIANSYVPPQDIQVKFEKQWKNDPQHAQNYLKMHRININVRQVYPTED